MAEIFNPNHGNERGIANDFPTLVGAGETHYTYERKFGLNLSVGTSFEDIWDGTSAMTWPSSADTLDVVSSHANDTDSTGSAARQIVLEGLDSSFNTLTETVALSGVTPVTTSGSFIRLNRAYVSSYGTYETAPSATSGNQGNISITVTTGGALMGYITAGYGQSQMLRYTVPNGKTALIRSLRLFDEATQATTLRGLIRLSADDTSAPVQPWRTILYWPGLSAPEGASADFAIPFPAKTDICIQAKTAAGGAEVSGILDILLK